MIDALQPSATSNSTQHTPVPFVLNSIKALPDPEQSHELHLQPVRITLESKLAARLNLTQDSDFRRFGTPIWIFPIMLKSSIQNNLYDPSNNFFKLRGSLEEGKDGYTVGGRKCTGWDICNLRIGEPGIAELADVETKLHGHRLELSNTQLHVCVSDMHLIVADKEIVNRQVPDTDPTIGPFISI